MAFLRRVGQNFVDDDCTFLAAAVAYQLFFALVPLLLLLAGLLGFFLEGDELRDEVARIVGQVVPLASERRFVDEIAGGRALSLGIGLVGTAWSVTAIHAALDRAFARVFGRTERRTFVHSKLEALLLAALLVALAVASIGFSVVVQAIGGLGGGAVGPALALASPLFGLVAGTAFFLIVYWVVPTPRLVARELLVGAVTAAALWEVAKLAFAVYARAIGAFRAYGVLAFAAGVLTWIYLSAMIVLLGAEVMKTRATAAR